MSHVSVKEVTHESGETGVFGEVFIGLGLLIGLVGLTFWVLSMVGFYDDSPVGATAARGDWIALGFLFFIEGLGFTLFGIMALVAGWDRHHHPDAVH